MRDLAGMLFHGVHTSANKFLLLCGTVSMEFIWHQSNSNVLWFARVALTEMAAAQTCHFSQL